MVKPPCCITSSILWQEEERTMKVFSIFSQDLRNSGKSYRITIGTDVLRNINMLVYEKYNYNTSHIWYVRFEYIYHISFFLFMEAFLTCIKVLCKFFCFPH